MNWLKNSLLGLALLSLPSLAVSQDKTDSAKAVKGDEKESSELVLAGGKIVLTKPESWKTVKPQSQMIVHEFRAPAEGEKSARVTIMGATGGIETNVNRWIGQFEGAKKEDAKIEVKEIEKTKVHIVQLEGTFKGMMAPGAPKLPDHAMIGIILELKDGTTEFIKITGPKEIVAKEKDGIMKMLEGLKNK